MPSGNHFITFVAQKRFGQIKEKDGEQQNKDHKGIGHGVFIDVFNGIENFDSNHLPVVKNERGAQICECPDKDNNGTGKITR